MRTWSRAAIVLGCALAACSEPAPPDPHATYWRDAKPILAARCEGCHNPDGIGPFDLSTYETAKTMAASLVASAANRTMPPWMPSTESPKIKHERRLSDAEIATLERWLADGTREGDPSTMPAPSKSDIDTIEPSAELAMPAPYKPDVSLGNDDYRCFVLDPQLAADTAVTGFDIRPGNKRVVHHVILFNVAPGDVSKLAALEAQDPAPGYTCFGDAGVDALMVGAWVPGITATRFPEGTGVIIERGAKLVMQVHYNMLSDKQGTDQTTALLEYRGADAVKGAYIFPILDSSFHVPPGEQTTATARFNTQELYRYLPAGVDVKLHGVAPHMHLHGESIKVTQTKGDEVQTLIDLPAWDFHWQQFYFYEDAITLQRNATIELECRFDNRAAAQPIVNGQPTEPKDLYWGEGTLEEMCLNFFYASF